MQPPGIGRTPVISAPAIAEYFGIKNLTIKDESANLFGTHKDRKSLHVVREATNGNARLHAEVLCILTAGNAGLSLAKIGALHGVPAIAFVGVDSAASGLYRQLESACELVIPLDIEERLWSSEELCGLAGARQGRRVRDVTNGISKPFESIVDEIFEQEVPDTIVLPVGGGELFAGVADGLKRRGLQTRLIGVTVRKDSLADKLYSKWNPNSGQIDALTKLSSQHRLYRLEDEALLAETFNWLRVQGLQCEPSSAASFAALHDLAPQFRVAEKIMVINTGTFKLT
jgi:cysteine synthase